jgi:4-diphosphocytidyl-2-C-methyl-D-erythritol kinase
MSGSGATCFGLFTEPDAAREAAARLASEAPGWWVAAAPLDDAEAPH